MTRYRWEFYRVILAPHHKREGHGELRVSDDGSLLVILDLTVARIPLWRVGEFVRAVNDATHDLKLGQELRKCHVVDLGPDIVHVWAGNAVTPYLNVQIDRTSLIQRGTSSHNRLGPHNRIDPNPVGLLGLATAQNIGWALQGMSSR